MSRITKSWYYWCSYTLFLNRHLLALNNSCYYRTLTHLVNGLNGQGLEDDWNHYIPNSWNLVAVITWQLMLSIHCLAKTVFPWFLEFWNRLGLAYCSIKFYRWDGLMRVKHSFMVLLLCSFSWNLARRDWHWLLA